MIDVLIPVLGRPQNAARVASAIERATVSKHRILFLCSPGDDEQVESCRQTGESVLVVPWEPTRGDYPRKMNYGFRATAGEWVFLAADDIVPRKGWDQEALALDDGDVGVIGTVDNSSWWRVTAHSTHPLVRRSYIETLGGSLDGPGTIFHEGYDHNYCERELVGLAQYRGRYRLCRTSRIEHLHPLLGLAKADATYEKGRAHFRSDCALFLSRAKGWNYCNLTRIEQRSARAR